MQACHAGTGKYADCKLSRCGCREQKELIGLAWAARSRTDPRFGGSEAEVSRRGRRGARGNRVTGCTATAERIINFLLELVVEFVGELSIRRKTRRSRHRYQCHCWKTETSSKHRSRKRAPAIYSINSHGEPTGWFRRCQRSCRSETVRGDAPQWQTWE